MTTLDASYAPVTHAPEAAPGRRALRSVFAVVGGLVATFVVTTAVDMALHAAGVFPPFPQRMSDALFALALSYRVVLNTAGCNLAARLAPRNPERHALALGVVGCVLGAIGAIAMCDFGPGWYSLANIAIALPCAFVGGRLARLGIGLRTIQRRLRKSLRA